MKTPVKILLADDHSVVRQGTSLLLKRILEDVIIFQAATISESLDLIKEKQIELFILDAHFPEGSSLKLITQVKEIQPTCKILMFSALDEEMYAMRFINAGADGYLNKLSSENQILEAVRTMLTTGKYVSPAVKEKIVNSVLYDQLQNPFDILSDRELEIARLLVDGCGNLEISNSLNLRKSTVSTYKNRIFEKLKISNVVSLITLFRTHNEDF